jgi:hypothetical protein
VNREQQREEERGGSAEEHGELSESKERESKRERGKRELVCVLSVNFFSFSKLSPYRVKNVSSSLRLSLTFAL